MALNWKANPSQIDFIYDLNAAVPHSQDVVVNIKDTVNPNDIYTKFVLEIYAEGEWVNITNYTNSDEVDDFTDAQTTITVVPFDVNVTPIEPGNYQGGINIRVIGILADGSGTEEVSFFNYPLTLLAYEVGSGVVVSYSYPWKTIYEYFEKQLHTIIDHTIADINGLDWSLTFLNTVFSITTEDTNVTSSTDGEYTTLTGNQESLIHISLANTWLNKPIGKYYENLLFYYGPSATPAIEIKQAFHINIIAFNGFDYFPKGMLFEGFKGLLSPEPQLLIIDSLESFTLTAPAWLSLTQTSGQYHTEISVVPVSDENTAIGTYKGTILIERTVDGETITNEIPITYSLHERISTPYSNDKIAFTLDRQFINFRSLNIDTYFLVKLSAKVYSFFTGIHETKTLFYKIPLFKQAQKFNVGQIVHRLMAEIPDYTDTSGIQYIPCDVSLYIEEKERKTDAVLYKKNINNIQFIAGLMPTIKFGNLAILDVNKGSVRVTPKSFYLLNMLIPSGNFMMKIIRNGDEYHSEDIRGGHYDIITKKLLFSNYNPGDSIVVKLENKIERIAGNGNHIQYFIEKKFLVLPEGKESNHIVFIDEYKLMKAIEFTGDYTIYQDFKSVYFEKYEGLLSVVDKVDSTKKAQLTINTGWLTKSDQVNITSLLSQKRAWLVFEEGVVLDLVPIGKKIKSVDNTRSLISFDVSFTINFKNNAQAYTF